MQTASKIFGGEIKTHLLAFFSGEDDNAEEGLAGLKEVASDFKGKVSYTPIPMVHITTSWTAKCYLSNLVVQQ